MSKPEPYDPRLDHLIGKLQEGDLDSDDRLLLNQLLREDPKNRQRYRSMMDLHRWLSNYHTGESHWNQMSAMLPARTSPETRGRPWYRSRQIATIGLAAALIAMVTLNVIMMGRSEPVDLLSQDDLSGVAILTESVGLVWGDHSPEFNMNDALPRGTLELNEGYAQIDFFSGAILTVEAPAQFELIDNDAIHISYGKMRLFVPEPAQGFRVEGPEFDTIDLGTEFAFSVDREGQSEVHVLNGEVAIHAKDGATLFHLATGESLRHALSGGFESIANAAKNFVGRESILDMASAHWQAKHNEWQQERAKWLQDPDTVIYYDFEDQTSWQTPLDNPQSDQAEAAIVGARWSEGRWAGKGALDFKTIHDRVRLRVGREFKSFTFSMHLRVDSFADRKNALFMSDDFPANSVHWQINETGIIGLGISDAGRVHSEVLFEPRHLGHWRHLAVTYDYETGQVTHFMDGEVIGQGRIRGRPKVQIQSAELGNWKKTSSNRIIRALNGSMDEFLFLERALSEEEVRRLHQ
ncbi:MAG: LamG-like jellyroll fold domain-containing protein [Verrucomicrobiota bacterium]